VGRSNLVPEPRSWVRSLPATHFRCAISLAAFAETEVLRLVCGQVERVNDDAPLLPTIDIWDWYVVQDHVSKGQPVARLVGMLI